MWVTYHSWSLQKRSYCNWGDTLITCYDLYLYLFSDAPAKKEDYMKVSTSIKVPLQFCVTRWLEDVAVAERVILIWPDIQMFIAQICAGPKSKIPKSHSFTSSTGSESGPSCSSKTTILLHNWKSTTCISRSVLKRKTNVTFYGRVSV